MHENLLKFFSELGGGKKSSTTKEKKSSIINHHSCREVKRAISVNIINFTASVAL